MKIKYLLLAGLTLLLVILYMIPATSQANITINVPLIRVYNQLNTPSGWKKWYVDAKDSAKFQIESRERGRFAFSVLAESVRVQLIDALTFGVAADQGTYSISLLEQPYDKKTTVIVSYKTSLLSSLLPGQADKWLKKTALYSLKNYLESPAEYYGVNFRKTMTSDMLMIVYKSTVKPGEVLKSIEKAAAIIQQTIPADDFADKDKIYVQTSPAAGGFDLFVGMNIKKKPAKTYAGLSYMHLYPMKSLTVSYDGIYSQRRKVYTGVDEYLHDHAQVHFMPPLEIYSKDNLPMTDTGKVAAEIIIPVR